MIWVVTSAKMLLKLYREVLLFSIGAVYGLQECSLYFSYTVGIRISSTEPSESNYRLSDRLQQVKLENKSLRGIAANYKRVKRAFGPQEVEAAVESIRQREQADKARKRPQHPFSWGGTR